MRKNLDRETLNEMVKLKFGARKAGGPEIDLVKLVADTHYAVEIFSAIENLPDEQLVLLALILRDKFDLLTTEAATPLNVSSRVKETNKSEPAQRYFRGARG